MKKLLVSTSVALALASAVVAPVMAQDADVGAAVGGASGGITGSIVGGLIFGPIGAIIGGFSGAVIGASVISEASIEYARLHPTEPVGFDEVDIGWEVPADVEIVVLADDPDYGYFYTEDRVWFVELDTRTVAYSPGTVVAAEVEVNASSN